MKKQLLLFLALACVLLPGMQSVKGQTPKENRITVFIDLPRFLNLSDNAKWAIGFTSGGGSCYRVNLENEDVVIIDSNEDSEIYDVSDEGMVVGTTFGFPAIWTPEGEMIPLPLPDGIIEGVANGITPDGKYIAGVSGKGFSRSSPIRWTLQSDGSYTYEELMIFEKDLYGKEPMSFMLDIISSDGSIMAGRMIDDNAAWIPMLWKNIEVTPEPITFGLEELFDEEGNWNGAHGSPMSFTLDGQYIVGLFDLGSYTIKSFLYSVEENKIEIPTLSGEMLFLRTSDGKLISGSPGVNLYRSAFIDIPGQEGMPLEEYVQENFGLNMLEEMDRSGTPIAISADDKTIVGWSGHRSGPMVGYCLRMGVDPSGIKAIPTEKPEVYADADSRIVVKGAQGATVTLSDMSGKVLSSAVACPNAVIPAEKGIYIVKVALSNVSFINKIAVK